MHVTLKVIEWAKEHHIILQLLPAHSSHILQPLDVGCYGPLQKNYDNLCHKLMRTNICAITKHDVCSLTYRAYGTALSTNNLQSAFWKTGLYPFDKDIINNLPLKPSEVFACTETHEVEGEKDMHVVESEREEEEDGGGVKDECSEGEREIVCEDEEVICCVSEKRDVNNFFVSKIAGVKKVKGERKTKKRNVLSGIVSGKTLTEDSIVEKVKDHVDKYSCKKVSKVKGSGKKNCNEKDGNKKGSSANATVQRKRTSEKVVEDCKKVKMSSGGVDSQEPGPSRIYINENSELDTESESEVRVEEKCCVCKQFIPDEVRRSVSLIFTKLAQCDSCGHWIHLVYCTKVRVLRRGDSFHCMHCKSGDE